MKKDLKSNEKVNDLKKIIEIQNNNYNEIIDIFLKYVTTYDDAKAYVVKYLPKLVNDINIENSLLMLRKSLDIFKYYLYAKSGLSIINGIKTTKIIEETKSLTLEQFIKWIVNVVDYNKNRQFNFLISMHLKIKNDEIIEESLKNTMLQKIKQAEEYYYNYFNNKVKNKKIHVLKIKKDIYYNFVEELFNSSKEIWSQKIKAFFDSQDNEIECKNKLLEIILILKSDSTPLELLKIYNSMNNIFNSSIETCKDPFTNEFISKKIFDRKYGKLIKLFDELIKTDINDRQTIIELFLMISEDVRYLSFKNIKEKIIELFIKLYPNFTNMHEIVEQKLDIYIEYKKKEREKNFGKGQELKREKISEKHQEKLQAKIKIAQEMINNFLASKFYVIEEYKKHFNLAKYIIDGNLTLISKHDEQLYSKYLKRQEDGIKIINRKIIELIKYLKNDDFDIFDIIDYYKNINVDLMILRYYVINSNLEKNDKDMLINFIWPNYSSNEYTTKEFLDTNVEFNCDIDKNGNPIQGTGVVVSREIREEIVSYLNENKIPLNNITFRAMIKRYYKDNIKSKKI